MNARDLKKDFPSVEMTRLYLCLFASLRENSERGAAVFVRLGVATALLIFLFSASVAAQDKPKIFFGASSKTLGYSPFWIQLSASLNLSLPDCHTSRDGATSADSANKSSNATDGRSRDKARA
jgi:hypothetical protein